MMLTVQIGAHVYTPTAVGVARERAVCLETVRSQIRTLLRKSEAANLRDFQRIGTVLASILK